MTWQFRPKSKQESVRDPVHEEFFADDAIRDVCEALVREGIQNSLDAQPTGSTEPVVVRLGVRSPLDRPDSLDASRRVFMDGLDKHWSAPGNGLVRAPAADDALHWLLFEDFGTTGLTGDPAQDFPEEAANPFFAFFRAEGYSEKQATQRGRWGLGKFAFPRASRGRCFFGLTVRYDDSRRFLMGRCTLKSHKLSDARYTPDGFFGIWNPDLPVMPYEDEASIDRFVAAFGLARDESRPGLSVVVPFVDPTEVTTKTLLSAVVRGYWLALLTGQLEVRLIHTNGDVQEISTSSLDEAIKSLPASEAAELRPAVELARWALQRESGSHVRTGMPPSHGAPRWDTTVLSPDIVGSLRERAELGRVAVRVPVRIRRSKGGGEAESWFDVLLERTGDGKAHKPVFIREGILISDVRARIPAGWRAIVRADDDAIATFLGDSENPAHTRWVREGSHFKGKYERGADWIAFVVAAPGAIADSLSAGDQEADATVLSDVLSVVLPESVDPTRKPRPIERDADQSGVPEPELPKQARRYRLTAAEKGFAISSGNVPVAVGTEIALAVAYDTRMGNPFKQWQEFDFDVSRPPIRLLDQTGLDVLERRANRLRIKVMEPFFRLVVTGFDEFRDLKVDARVAGQDSE